MIHTIAVIYLTQTLETGGISLAGYDYLSFIAKLVSDSHVSN